MVSFCLALIIHRMKQHCQQASPVKKRPGPWTQASKMEKKDSESCPDPTEPPPVSATEVLKPLSRDGPVLSSGAVAAKAREQIQSAEPSRTSKTDIKTQSDNRDEGNSSVQRRSESVQQMREVDVDGVRTWKRLTVEYH